MFAHGLVLLKVSQRQGQGEMRHVMFGPVMQSLLVGLDRIGISLRRKNQAEVVSGIGIRRRDRQTTQQPSDLGVLRGVIHGFSEEARTRGFPSPPLDGFGFTSIDSGLSIVAK